MPAPVFDLPDNVDALKAMVLAMAEKAARAEVLESEVADLKALNASAEERIARLTSILKTLERARFGRRSEKLGANAFDDEQSAFVFDEVQTGLGAIQAELDKRQDPDKARRAARPRKGFCAASRAGRDHHRTG
ncbi:MAG: transposase [Methylovirgula sp.]|uniref:transposase n=1 Tax=Methylovirgula sp. TaxID=1978224 RepID=UPI0030764B79